MNNSPEIACELSAINKNQIKDHRENGEAVFEAVSEIRETSNGYEFRLPADTKIIKQAGAFIARERLCCPFFEFSLTVKPDKNPVWLQLSGPGRSKKVYEGEFAASVIS